MEETHTTDTMSTFWLTMQKPNEYTTRVGTQGIVNGGPRREDVNGVRWVLLES